MAPCTRVTMYKVCWAGGCFRSNILAAVDRAVADDVEVLSISLGSSSSSNYHDSLVIASFGSMQLGGGPCASAGLQHPSSSGSAIFLFDM